MKISKTFPFVVATIAIAILTTLVSATVAGEAKKAEPRKLLWQIGKPDGDDREFALAPAGYNQFREDGFFVVGKSDPRRDWPYVHPGPVDGWAGERIHTFVIVFGLKSPPPAGQCRFLLDLVDTHKGVPPRLRVSVNGHDFRRRLPDGAGDASVFGDPAKGRPHREAIAFPATLLRAGANEISITIESGCWMLYDCLRLETPPAAELTPVGGTLIGSTQSPAVLVERGGKLMQAVRVAVRHFGEAMAARLCVDGAEPTAVSLKPGPANFEVLVPAVEAAKTVAVRLEADGKTLAANDVRLEPVRKWVVYLLPHSHVDIGYTHVQTDVEKAQWQYLDTAIEAAQRSAANPPGARFKWNVEVLWAVDSYLKQATPEKRQRFINAVKAGQVGLQALYGNQLTGLCSPEELLRLMSCAQRISKLCDTPVTSAMITDVPGYTWGIVPAMAHSGVKYFSIGPNGGDRIGHTIAAWGDKPFWWIGPNGKDKVLVWMTGTGYYRVFSSGDNLLQYLGSLQRKGYAYDFVQVRHCLGDNGAPDVNFADTVKKWNATYAYPKLVIATTDEMFRDFQQRYGDKIPTAKGDFTPYWEDGAGSSSLETAMNRASADRLLQAEALFALANPKAYPAEDFYQAWRNVILYDEHTWGAHNSISEPDHPFVKSQWAIKRQFAVDGESQSRKLLAAADAARGALAVAPPKMQAIDVINTTPSSYPYALVTAPKELSTAGDAIRYDPTKPGGPLAQRLTTGELVFRPCFPGLHVRRCYVTDDPPAKTQFQGASAQGNTLSTSNSAVERAVTLRIDAKTGAIASLVYNGRELVDSKAPTALNDYFYLPGSDLKGLARNGPVRISVKEKGPLMASLLVESDAPGCNKLIREYRLWALRNYVEIIDTVDKKAVRTKEGVHFGFAFNVPGGEVRMHVPFGVVRPEIDQIPGACKNWFTVQRWVDVSNAHYGVTWLTPDAPLVQVGGVTANLIGSLNDTRAWKNKIEPSTTLYSWAMNNHWHTNYVADQSGRVVFRYVLRPHEGRSGDAEAARFAREYSQPLLVVPARGPAPQAASRLVSVNGGVQVSALKPSEDGKAWIVRLLGDSGKPQKVKLHWNRPPKQLSLSDNSEKAREPLDVNGPIDVPAWSVVTLRAELPD